MSDTRLRKEQLENGENIAYKNEDNDFGSNDITTAGVITAGSFVGLNGTVNSVNGQTGDVVLDTDDISEGSTNLYFSNERAQDAVGAMVNSTLVYTDATPVLGRAAISGDITISAGSNTAAIGSGVIINADINSSAGIDASKIANGTVSSTEFQYLDGVTSAIQTQITARVSLTGNETIAGVKTFSSIPELPASDPTTANQATRKSYVDVIGQMVDPSLYKNACTCATTANITLSGEQTIDGFATSATRVLVWNQTAPAENGIYISNSGAWTRASDYNTAAEVLQGTSTFITDGTVNKNRLFVMNAASITTLGTDPITFTPLSGLNEYLPGDGIDITGNTISTDNAYLSANLDYVNKNGTVAVDSIPTFYNTSGDIKDSGVSLVVSGSDIVLSKTSAGDFYLNGVNGGTNPGAILLNAGNAQTSSADGGSINITAGSQSGGFASTSRHGGDITITAGNEDSGDTSNAYGGGVYISGGTQGFTGNSGASIALTGGTTLIDRGTMSATAKTMTLSITDPLILLDNSSGFSATLDVSNLTADRAFVLPDSPGTLGFQTDVQVFTSSGTWTKPAGAKSVLVQLIGGGGGGGSGRKGAASTIRAGGAGGGAGGWSMSTFSASVLGSTETVTVGTGGAGGASRTANDSSGLNGTAGNSTLFGGWLRAGSGTGGGGGAASAASGGFAGQLFPPGSATSNNGASSSGTGSGGSSPGINQLSPGSGGSGGGITTANAASNGGGGSGVGSSSAVATNSGYATFLAGGSGGTSGGNGGNGNVSPTNSAVGGSGGGGGASSTTTNAGTGGNGATYGAGGGGGGAAVNSVGNSGAGGSGANGIAIITTYF